MEEFRDILNELIQRNPDDYLKTEIVQISTQLDEIILKYITHIPLNEIGI